MLTIIPDIEGMQPTSQYRLSRERFRINLIIACALTAAVCGLFWLLLGIYGSRHMNLYTALVGLVFFAFISARLILQYFRNEIILAIQPTGIYDGRITSETIEWEKIKEMVLRRKENEYSLLLHLWKKPPNVISLNRVTSSALDNTADYEIDLTSLDAAPDVILSKISQYAEIRLER